MQQRHNFSFCQQPKSSSRQRRSPSFNKENQRPGLSIDRVERLLNHNQQLLVENEKLAVRAGEIQLIRQSNAELERNNTHLRESLRLAASELQCQQTKQDHYKLESEATQYKLKSDMVMLAKKLEQAELLCKNREDALQNYKQQEQRRLTIMAERLSKLQLSISQNEQIIAQLRREKEQIEKQLQQQRSQFKYEIKHHEEEHDQQRSSFERELSILREELEKKQLEIVYLERLSQQELKQKEEELGRISALLKEKQEEELQAVEIIRMLEAEKENAQRDHQHLLEKLRNLEKNLQEQYSSRAKELEQAYQSRIDNYKRESKQLQRTNRELKQSLEEKVDEAETMRQTLQQMSEFVRDLKKKCQELSEKHNGLQRNFEARLEHERSRLRESFEMMMNSRKKDDRVRQALDKLQPSLQQPPKQFVSPGSSAQDSSDNERKSLSLNDDDDE